MSLLISLIVNALTVMIAAYIVPNTRVDSFLTAVLVSIVMAVMNAIVKPVLTILTLPLTIVTFGLFLFVINLIVLYLVDAVVPGFELGGLLSTILFAIALSVIGSITNSLAAGK
jgi:putative membrane protein